MEHEKGKLCSSNKKGLAAATTEIPEKPSPVKDGIRHSDLNEQTPSSFTLKFITWNIDGLQRENLKVRTEAVCKIIEAEQADIVFLQELVPVTADYIVRRMPNYRCCFADEVEEGEEQDREKESESDEDDQDDEEDDEDDEEDGYFVGTLLNKSTVTFVDDEVEVVDFPLSRMSRNLLKVNVTYKDLPICLLNSHLESLLKCSEERKNQLKIVFKHMLDAPENETVIFGGDTNLRDRELTELGGLPPGIEDVWMACGSQKRCEYTFDTLKNDNLDVNWKARCRYDRVYMRRSSPSMLKPASFELIGLRRLVPYGCFPSDHWGVLCHFEKDNFRFKLDEVFSHDTNDEVQKLQPFWIRKLRIHQ